MNAEKKLKVNLPKDWVVRLSNNHPDRVYYFNMRTGKSSWTLPTQDPPPEPPPGRTSTRSKRKDPGKEPDEENQPGNNGTAAKSTDPAQRKMLRAKRRTDVAKPSSNETPQMRLIRQKMLEKQEKLEAAKSKKRANTAPIPLKSPPSPDKADSLKRIATVRQDIKTGEKSKTPVATARTPMLKSTRSGARDDASGRGASKTKSPSKTLARSSISTPRSTDSYSDVADTSVSPCSIRSTVQAEAKTRKQRSSIVGKTNTPISDASKLGRSSLSAANASSTRRNIAKERLENLRKSLSSEREKLEPALTRTVAKKLLYAKRTKVQESEDNDSILARRLQLESTETIAKSDQSSAVVVNEDARNHKRHSTSPLDIFKNAETRLKALRHKLLNDKSHVDDQSDETNALPSTTKIPRIQNATTGSIRNSANTNTIKQHPTNFNSLIENCNDEAFYEEMDWEPIEDEKMVVEIQEVRKQLIMQLCREECILNNILKDSNENGLLLPKVPQPMKEKELYVIVDTNVFLSNLPVVEEIKDSLFKNFERPIVVVPWTVLQELDYIKDNRSRSKTKQLQYSARKAINFLNELFSKKHPRVKGQTAADATANKTIFEVECPDDGILQSCLQISQTGSLAVLLSYDKNLCNKAMVHGIDTLGRDDSVQSIDNMGTNKKKQIEVDKTNVDENKSGNEDSTCDEELEISDDIFGESKAVVKRFLSTIVAKDMEELFGENWENHTIIRPPWSVIDVLQCALKHWIAAVGESFQRQAEPVMKDLLDIFKNADKHARKLRDVSNVLEKCSDFVQMAKPSKYHKLKIESWKGIKELKDRCEESIKKLLEEKYRNGANGENDILVDEERVQNAFKYFHEIWVFVNNFCGIAADMMGIPHTITYTAPNTVPSVEFIRQMQPTLAESLIRLSRALGTVLNEADSLHPHHGDLITLYEVLMNFIPNLSLADHLKPLTPLELLCCVKRKLVPLRTGLNQFQELNDYLCRMSEISL